MEVILLSASWNPAQGMVLDIYLVPFYFSPRLLVLTLDIPNIPVLSDFGQSCLSNFAFRVSRGSPASEFIRLLTENIDQTGTDGGRS